MKLILNADDFGQSQDTFEETVRCLEARALTSATIMVNMPYSAEAMAYARDNDDFSFGVHLTFVRESEHTVEGPVSDPQAVSSLVDEDGRFKISGEIRKAAMSGRLDEDEIAREIEAQIKTALDHGVQVSHVDSHGHLHKFGPFVGALRRVLPQFGIDKVRTVQDIYLKTPWRSPTYWLGRGWRKQIRASFTTTDHLYLPTSAWDESWPERLLEVLAHREGIVEVGVHPGINEDWRKGESQGTSRLAELARERGLTLTDWRNVS